MMKVTVRAFNADGYHRDICVMSEKQVHSVDPRLDETCTLSMMSGLLGVAHAGIDPTKFPEAIRFEIVIEK
jgi:hypothetical protein